MTRLLLLLILAGAAFGQPPEFRTVPAGSFVMGCDPGWPCAETLPRHRVDFPHPFQIMQTEVTVAQFRVFVRATAYRTDAEKAGESLTWQSPGFRLSARQPVVFLSFNDAKAFCASIGARVPLESEWEYAARAGTSTFHYWGEEIDDRYLWYFNNTDQHPEPVGRKLPNAWGLYDMEGNAMEWVAGGGPHSSVTAANTGCPRGGSYAMCPEPYPPQDGRRQRFIGLGPTFSGATNSNFRPDERRFDYGIRCAK
jgi:formylglycine-generating enzyme required for sulfatase activity